MATRIGLAGLGLVTALSVSITNAGACSIVLHTPDGFHHFSAPAKEIQLIEPVDPSRHDHLAPHTNSIVMIGGKYRGVRETEAQVTNMRAKCMYGSSPK